MILWKKTLALRAFGLLRIPFLFFASPTVLCLDDDEAKVSIPLHYRTRNHLKSMYFGALSVGADCAGGLLAMHLIKKSKKKISIVFKDFKAQFLKRPAAAVHFHCGDGKAIRRQIAETVAKGKRTNQTITVTATTPSISADEPVALFDLTLSMKVSGQ